MDGLIGARVRSVALEVIGVLGRSADLGLNAALARSGVLAQKVPVTGVWIVR